MRKPFIQFKPEYGYFPAKEIKAPEGYEIPKNKETGESFPNCCESHRAIYKRNLDWFERFPNCCDFHLSQVNYNWYKKEIFKNVPDLILTRLSYTEYIIAKHIDSDDWFEVITDFIEHINRSFGFPSIGVNEYLSYVEWYIKNETLPKSKQEQLLNFMSKYDSVEGETKRKKTQNETDLNVLYSTYQKWLKEFPFHIKMFAHLKPKFEKQLPIIATKPTINRFSGDACFTLHTKESLIGYLLKLTDILLREINTAKMYHSGHLTKTEDIKLELILNERKLKLKEGYASKVKSEESKYRKALKSWYRDEKKFLQEIEPFLLSKSQEPEQPEESLLSGRLNKYGFFELERVEAMPQEKQFELIKKLSERKLPYIVAMLDFLGFINHIQKQHSRTLDKRNKIISQILKSDKNGRTVKGLINSLNNPSEKRYTAHLHKETVEKDYQKLK